MPSVVRIHSSPPFLPKVLHEFPMLLAETIGRTQMTPLFIKSRLPRGADLLGSQAVRVRCYLLIAAWLVANGLVWLPSCRAVLFEATGDPSFNTSAPGGALLGSGWQYE